jgi:riboflavin synthase
MFSGIVETVGNILDIQIIEGCKKLSISPKNNFDDLVIGESISVNGVCLTVTDFSHDIFHVTAVPETLRLTNLNHLDIGSSVNLERSLKLNSRLGGHYVQGHVDGMGQILEIKNDHSNAWLVKINVPEKLAKYLVAKGYIALDGMSITIIQAEPDWITVTFIPHTQEVTITQHYACGQWINIEVDIMGKYIEKLLGVQAHVN